MLAEGALGRIYHFRARYLQEGRLDPERPAFVGADALGRAALPNLGTHVIDMARVLVGEPESVAANLTIHIASRPHPQRAGERVVTTEADAFQCVLNFANGASGVIEASFVAAGRKNHFEWEINGEKGSLRFNLERLNELSVYLPERSHPAAAGFQEVLVTEPTHPFIGQWWPRGHALGWEHTFVHEIEHLLQCVVRGRPVGPEGATFADGYRARAGGGRHPALG